VIKLIFKATIIGHFILDTLNRRKTRLLEVNIKCRHLKTFTCKGTFRQVFIRVYRLEIADFLHTFSHVGIFNPALRSVFSPVARLAFSLVQLSSPFPVCIVYCTVCKGSGPQQINTCRKVPFTGQLLDDDILHCLLRVLSF
jgi:hypothetical protein